MSLFRVWMSLFRKSGAKLLLSLLYKGRRYTFLSDICYFLTYVNGVRAGAMKNAPWSKCKRSVLRLPTQRAALADAACCVLPHASLCSSPLPQGTGNYVRSFSKRGVPNRPIRHAVPGYEKSLCRFWSAEGSPNTNMNYS